MYYRFYPHLDGLFLHRNERVTTMTDSEGRFSIALKARARSLAVRQEPFRPTVVDLEELPRGKEVVLRLELRE